ncbi:hypothetical protein P3G55_15810 [Leptospira sp. 96542]|nr:hypothetical protein [Leptospira sp. 96542]
MKNIRYYIKKVLEFPNFLLVNTDINLNAMWRDCLSKENLKTTHFQFDFNKISDNDIISTHCIIAFLLNDPNGEIVNIQHNKLEIFLKNTIPNLLKVVSPYTEWTTDNERAEELVRSLFLELELLPEGETSSYFQDRYLSINSIERVRIFEESKKAQNRAREILAQMKLKEAEEAASKYNRE